MNERQNQILLSLREITQEVSAQKTFEQACSVLVHSIRNATKADCCSLYVVDASRQYMRLAATDGLAEDAVGKVTLKFGEGLVGLVGKKQQVVNLADAPSHPSFKYLPEVGEDEFISFLGVPVINQGVLLGVLVIQSCVKRQFGEAEESFLITLATQIAAVISAHQHDSDAQGSSGRFQGESGTGGIAIAKAVVWFPAVSLEDVKLVYSDDAMLQQELFHQAMFQLQTEMDRAALKMKENDNEKAAFGYMSGYGHLLDDMTLQDDIDTQITDYGLTAPSALKAVIEKRLEEAQRLGQNDLAIDLRDYAQVLLARLVHSHREMELDTPVVLVVKSLPAAWVAELPRDKIAGFVSVDSTTSSHTSILARDLGIPSVIGAKLDLNTVDGHNLIVDGERSRVFVDPAPSVVDEYRQMMNASAEQINLYSADKFEKGITLDKQNITIQLNAGLNHSYDDSVPRQTDGIGLYRTEIAFMLGKTFPTEQQQTEWYSKLLSRFKGQPVCMRTLDIGGDKGLDYLPIREPNPALGWRGVRVTVDQPQILKTQLRAMLLAQQEYGNLEIMVPMVSRYEEVITVRNLLDECVREISEQTGKEVTRPRFGVMVEVPSIVYLMDDLAPEVDFFSIGSNDLTQYLLAIDRSNPKVNRFFDHFHPAVLRCLAEIREKAAENGKPVSVCGQIAGSPLGALMLLSLGYTRLSMNYSELGRIKYLIRRVSVADLQEVGRKALSLVSGEAIRQLYSDYAVSRGLGRIVESGEKKPGDF